MDENYLVNDNNYNIVNILMSKFSIQGMAITFIVYGQSIIDIKQEK